MRKLSKHKTEDSFTSVRSASASAAAGRMRQHLLHAAIRADMQREAHEAAERQRNSSIADILNAELDAEKGAAVTRSSRRPSGRASRE